jgi:hypothetical protein
MTFNISVFFRLSDINSAETYFTFLFCFQTFQNPHLHLKHSNYIKEKLKMTMDFSFPSEFFM